MEIRPVHNDDDHAAALRRIDEIWGAAPGTPEEDELDILATLIERFEEARWPVERVTPLEMLRFMMEQGGRTQSDLATLFGSRSRASEVLNGKRELTLDQIRLLRHHWGIPVDVLIGDLEAA